MTRATKVRLAKQKEVKLVLDWRNQKTTRTIVFTTSRDILDQLPRAYTKELYEQKCDVVYQHFYESYIGQGKSVYGAQ
jgi:type I restriction enzyme R subunit